MGAVLVAASTADLLWSIGVFVGTPAALFVVLAIKHYAQLRRQRSRDQQEADSMLEEGYPPGPPVGDDDDP
jgi:predicted PurR-regulated permease PerM